MYRVLFTTILQYFYSHPDYDEKFPVNSSLMVYFHKLQILKIVRKINNKIMQKNI